MKKADNKTLVDIVGESIQMALDAILEAKYDERKTNQENLDIALDTLIYMLKKAKKEHLIVLENES